MAIQATMWKRLTTTVALGVGFLLLTVVSWSTMAPTSQTVASVPGQPSIVSTSGTQLIVQKRKPDGTLDAPRPYTIEGVNWSPASTCTVQSYLSDEFQKWDEIDIPLMAAMGVNTVRTYYNLGPVPTATHILDRFYEHGIMVIMTVDEIVANAGNITPTVNAHKDHPAILMWAIGPFSA